MLCEDRGNCLFAKIWEFTDKGTYGIINLSTSKKNKDTGVYETDFQNKFTSAVGQAYEFVKGLGEIPKNGVSVKIGNCATSNKYDGEKKITYWNCAVFALEDASFNGNGGNAAAAAPAPAKGKKTPASDVAMCLRKWGAMAAEGTILDDLWFFADNMGLDLRFDPARSKNNCSHQFLNWWQVAFEIVQVLYPELTKQKRPSGRMTFFVWWTI